MSNEISNQEETVSRIGQNFTLISLLKFALPGLLTAFFSRIFETLDDGLFVSRYVGQTALAGVKILDPLNSLMFALTHLFALGASTFAAHRMGQGKNDEANKIFTRSAIMAIGVGLVFSIIFNVFIDEILIMLGSNAELLPYGEIYIRLFYTFAPFYLLVNSFASFYSVAGNPSMQLFNSILDGSLNIIFDIIFIVILDMGVAGTALANTLAQIIISIIGLIFYSNPKHEIHFVKVNGGFIETFKESFGIANSQILNSLSFGLCGYVNNLTIISFLGNNGVAAHAIVHDLRRILSSSIIGYSSCVGPILAFNYASRNQERLKRIIKYNFTIWFFGSLLMTIIGQLCKTPLISLYITDNTSIDFYNMTYYALTIEFCACAFTGGAIMILRMFVAFKNNKVSRFLSIERNIVSRLACLFIIPRIFGAIGVWWAFPISEFIAFMISLIVLYLNRNNYGYGKDNIAYLMKDLKETE